MLRPTHDESTREGGPAPAVSIIIPAYNVAQYIRDTIESVLAQTFTDYEIIVINDGSPDTPEMERVLEPYRHRLVYLKQENRGLSGARNTGIRAARADLIALLDSDDMWEPDYLAVQVEAMRADPTIDVLYTDALIFGDGAEAGQRFMDRCPSEGEVTFESLLSQRCNVMVSVTARREAIVRAGLFDETLRSSEDFDMWLRVVKQGGRIAYHRRPLVRYRRRRGSLSSDPVWMCNHVLQVLDKAERNFALTPGEREVLRETRERFRAMLRFHEGKRAFFQGDTRAAIAGLAEANRFLKSRKLALTLILLRRAPRLLSRAYDMRDQLVLRKSTKF